MPDASKSAEEAAPAAPAAPVETDGSPEEERKLFLGGLSTVQKQGIGIGLLRQLTTIGLCLGLYQP